MGLPTNLSSLATRIAVECKALRTLVNGNGGDLSGLSTSAKASLVAAINELHASINASGGAGIDDATSGAASTWSSQKISAEIQAAKDQLVNGSSAALDTLSEIAAALGDMGTNFVTIFENGLTA